MVVFFGGAEEVGSAEHEYRWVVDPSGSSISLSRMAKSGTMVTATASNRVFQDWLVWFQARLWSIQAAELGVGVAATGPDGGRNDVVGDGEVVGA